VVCEKNITFAVQSVGKAIEGLVSETATGECTPTYLFLLLKKFNNLLKYFFNGKCEKRP
jgi:hypothetical protein